MANDGSRAPRGLARRLWPLLRPYRGRLFLGGVSLFVASAASLIYPQGIRWLLDELSRDPDATSRVLAQAAQWGSIVALVNVVAIAVRHYQMSWLGERVVGDLRRDVFRSLVRQSPSWFQARQSGEIVSRVAADVTTLEALVSQDLSMALRNAVTLTGGLALLITQSPGLTLLMVAIVPPVAVGVVVFGRWVRTLSRVRQDHLASASGRLEEAVAAMDTVQAFGREAYEIDRFRVAIDHVVAAGLRLAWWRAGFMGATSFAGLVALAVVLGAGMLAVVRGELSAGQLTAFLMYTLVVGTSVGTLASVWGSLLKAAGATDRLFEIIDAPPEVVDGPVTATPERRRGTVTLRQVAYAYSTRPDRLVLEDIDLDISAGEVVAVVGPSGAGKSTLVRLLLRYFDPTRGKVLIDGVDVRTWPIASLRAQMAMVAQEPVLFSGTIRDNIAYGRDGATMADIERAAVDAAAEPFIRALPKGYETEVGERGVRLSGGQKQRLAIARAILRDPRILILDEATSSLDAESEALVQEALARLMKDRTTIIIAHRLSTVREADRIVVLDGGRIVEVGPHAALMGARGVYHRLVEHQLVAESA